MRVEMHWFQPRSAGSDASLTLVTTLARHARRYMHGFVLGLDDITAYHARLTWRGPRICAIRQELWELYAAFEDADRNG